MPTPGSPPTSTSEAGTSPPPSTRSSSATPVEMRVGLLGHDVDEAERRPPALAAGCVRRAAGAPRRPSSRTRRSRGSGRASGRTTCRIRCRRAGGPRPSPWASNGTPTAPTASVPTSERSSAMRYRQLGTSDLEVSEIGLGSWLTFGGGVAASRPRACVDAAFDAGINFIDTANVYAPGAAEEFLGEVLAAPAARLVRARDEALLPDGRQAEPGPLARAGAKQIDASLAAAAHRLRRPLPVPPLRLDDAARGDDGGADRGRRAPARRATSASASGRRRRSRPRSTSSRDTAGEVRLARSRSTRCSGASPRPR